MGFNAQPNNVVTSVVVQTDGKLLIGGNFTSVNGVARSGMARLNADGTVDLGFDAHIEPWGVSAIVIQSDGKIMIGGGFSRVGGVTRLGVARLLNDPTIPIQQWKLAHLGDPNAADLGDPDHDGLFTLTEYGLDLFPETRSQLPNVSVFTYAEGDRLRMFVPRDPAHNDITVSVEATGDLAAGPWTPLATSTLGAPFTGPGYVGGDDATPGVKTVEVRDLVNLSATTQRWLRVKVTH